MVRAATLLRVATFATGASAVRVELVEALAELLNRGITPVVPRYGSVGASGDLMPSAYIARVLVGMGEAEFQGPAHAGLGGAGGRRARAHPLRPQRSARAHQRHHRDDRRGRARLGGRVPRAARAAGRRGAVRRSAPGAQSAVRTVGAGTERPPGADRRGGPPARVAGGLQLHAGLGRANAAIRCAACRKGWDRSGKRSKIRARRLEREINSANDNPLVDPETGALHKAGNFYGGHIARLLDTWKIDFASMANWGNAIMALLVDDRFNGGLPANLTPRPGANSGFKGIQLSVTSLACAIRQMAGPSSIHSLPTEQYNQDVVSLGMHAAVTAMDALECLRNETAMVLLAAAQAVDLRGGPEKLGRGSRRRVPAACGKSRAFRNRMARSSGKSPRWRPWSRRRRCEAGPHRHSGSWPPLASVIC